ncbi:chlorophyllide a oxygenase [Marchantia polymorpha subsp. ruderalis]|uniref:Rieske domain-containing protein n=2 Tax=Marchantia polymorpha TaxID=3197 RepID=A0AAF6BC78_MARPO|nr:hypothetical protein MARPO_0101s0060 [Marchantia polymorpha]BBN09612.1 hypothetical protein Mp_4g21140 [Marchantia polymorpha subsp. ruderalis]|eukprot:PTQ32273.1 hypothetical protein MARPO_0101s0060 [Marchantia polymorpha]
MAVAGAAGTGVCLSLSSGFGLVGEGASCAPARTSVELRRPVLAGAHGLGHGNQQSLSGSDGGAGILTNSLTSRQVARANSVANVRNLWGRKGRQKGAAQCIGVSEGREKGSSETAKETIFEVEDPRSNARPRNGVRDMNQAWEVLRQDVLYLDWRARQDVYAIKVAHDKVVETLNPLARELKSVETMKKQLAQLQEDLSKAHTQVHLSESRVEHTMRKLAEMESVINDKLLLHKSSETKMEPQIQRTAPVYVDANAEGLAEARRIQASKSGSNILNVSGPTEPYPVWLKNFWYPVAFTVDLKSDIMIPIESFEEPWVLFRGKDGRAGCVRDECAHRACPLSLGTVVDGRIQCPYHGWEYNTGGKCEKMPSTRPLKTGIRALPCIEQDGMVWIWPGDETPAATLPSLLPPENYTIHAEIVLELPVEHGLLMENLLDLAHAPFTHTSTFAKGWSVPNMVKFKTPMQALSGNWDPYPIDMAFQPPCMVLSTIGLVKPGKLDGSSTASCSKHLHQLHVCMPSSRGKTRLMYRMALDFAQWAKYVPYIDRVWTHLANQVLNEDLRLVEGQQDRMKRGANVWQTPVGYDKLGVRYRRWRNAVEAGAKKIPFESIQ